MNKAKWTDEEKAVLFLHFETANSVCDLEPMLPGRDSTTIRKKANALGLHRPDLKDLSHAKLLAAMGQEKLTVKQIAERLGYRPNSVNFLLQRAHDEDLCHICDHLPSQFCGKCAPLWIVGAGEHVPSDFAIERERKQAAIDAQRELERSRPARRDPFIEAMFGRAA
ncbi:hypothetical protein [Paraburkholderia sediminicola]|uniref:hypothetical protein n=1 Tax=Paraburkholderia sediminicola TaxID=458836 RepID=UPI0038B8991C